MTFLSGNSTWDDLEPMNKSILRVKDEDIGETVWLSLNEHANILKGTFRTLYYLFSIYQNGYQ